MAMSSDPLRLKLTGFAFFVCVASALHAAPAWAADDDDDPSFEERVMRNILSGMGVNTGKGRIEYRERSPLVIPPSMDLPPPDTTKLSSNPAWPKDPEIAERKKKAASKRQRPQAISELGDPGRPLTPSEMKQGGLAGAGQVSVPAETGPLTDLDIGRPLRPSELGYKGGVFRSLFKYKEEEVKFTGEPARTSLTQPPPGYMTPSAAQPYALGSKKSASTLSDTRVKDRAVGAD